MDDGYNVLLDFDNFRGLGESMKIEACFRTTGFDIILNLKSKRFFAICSYLPGDWVVPQIKRESSLAFVNKAFYLFIGMFCFAYERFNKRKPQ